MCLIKIPMKDTPVMPQGLDPSGLKMWALEVCIHTWFVQKVSGLTTVHEVDKAYEVLTLIVFNIVPLCSYTLHPTFLPLLETFCELLFRDV